MMGEEMGGEMLEQEWGVAGMDLGASHLLLSVCTGEGNPQVLWEAERGIYEWFSIQGYLTWFKGAEPIILFNTQKEVMTCQSWRH